MTDEAFTRQAIRDTIVLVGVASKLFAPKRILVAASMMVARLIADLYEPTERQAATAVVVAYLYSWGDRRDPN